MLRIFSWAYLTVFSFTTCEFTTGANFGVSAGTGTTTSGIVSSTIMTEWEGRHEKNSIYKVCLIDRSLVGSFSFLPSSLLFYSWFAFSSAFCVFPSIFDSFYCKSFSSASIVLSLSACVASIFFTSDSHYLSKSLTEWNSISIWPDRLNEWTIRSLILSEGDALLASLRKPMALWYFLRPKYAWPCRKVALMLPLSILSTCWEWMITVWWSF